jgi:hypothetical protein
VIEFDYKIHDLASTVAFGVTPERLDHASHTTFALEVLLGDFGFEPQAAFRMGQRYARSGHLLRVKSLQ